MTTTPSWTKAFGGAVTGYKTLHNGLAIITHRTYRSSPAGWVWGVCSSDAFTRETNNTDEHGAPLRNSGDQYAMGYASSRADGHAAAVDWIASDSAETTLRNQPDAIICHDHSCTFDTGEDYNVDPHWWTFSTRADGYSSAYVSAPTLVELAQKITAFQATEKAA